MTEFTGFLCIANKHFLKDACNFDLKFSDTEVDVVGLCQEGKFLLVGERSGNLHFIHVTSKQTLLTNVRPWSFRFHCLNSQWSLRHYNSSKPLLDLFFKLKE